MPRVRKKSTDDAVRRQQAPAAEPKLTIFSIINTILDRSSDATQQEQFASLYSPFFVNRALSMRLDTVLVANEANRFSNMPKDRHYDLVRGMIRPAKRKPVRWVKKQGSADADEDVIAMIQVIYQCNRANAIAYIELLGSANVQRLISEYQCGRQ